ncbi:hypothetical protein [Salinimicrobium sp. TH3]|uniref:hypothetical protein n=1 Tax=Salinimicrobium sp. TH3 TaxID=2997342 RepID=UPI002275EBF5|nr:hypothetical protein [Salinimicrobium sp. TH3]MCY2685934.1 hypothetical protein [Salinimicrobium sp. TH3]
MKTTGIIIAAILILGLIAVLTLVLEVIGFLAGVVLFIIAAIVLVYFFKKVKDKVS